MARRFAASCLLLAIAASIAAAAAAPAEPPPDDAHAYRFVRGVTITCFRWGPGEWDEPIMQRTLDDVRRLGATWAAIHPYARIRNNGTVDYRPQPVSAAVTRPTRWARQRGLNMMIKPHLAYWGSRFPDRLHIEFGNDDAAWDRFFDSYQRFIVHQANLAEASGARLFVVGTELDATLGHEQRWRRIIQAVNEQFSGELTYAANHDNYHRVPFWDALDCIGIQAYWPVSDAPAPTDAQLAAGWRERLDAASAFAAQHDKMVLLTELGYAASADAARRPWSSRRVENPDATDPDELKRRAMRVALGEVERRPRIAGVFLWKWFPARRDIDREFALQYPAMRKVIQSVWDRPPMVLERRWRTLTPRPPVAKPFR
jgi:hypothetical protein